MSTRIRHRTAPTGADRVQARVTTALVATVVFLTAIVPLTGPSPSS